MFLWCRAKVRPLGGERQALDHIYSGRAVAIQSVKTVDGFTPNGCVAAGACTWAALARHPGPRAPSALGLNQTLHQPWGAVRRGTEVLGYVSTCRLRCAMPTPSPPLCSAQMPRGPTRGLCVVTPPLQALHFEKMETPARSLRPHSFSFEGWKPTRGLRSVIVMCVHAMYRRYCTVLNSS